ncbi:STAS domain-containing protein [Chitinivorax sp. B]|uniref:STAS domain-containing protein n=1 Tax=Chitinivorax sp. B TaxID=2502235 RepID=UPI0010FA424B|nr:STAS domain-containing protein [Chitinivorax sp. B]
MSPKVEYEGKVAKVILAGQFDFNSHRDFRQCCETVIANPEVNEVQIDFQRVTYLDSSALGMLLLVKEKVNAANKSLALVNCKDTVRQVLEIACFGKIFTIR